MPQAGPSGLASAAVAQPEADGGGANDSKQELEGLDATALVCFKPFIPIMCDIVMHCPLCYQIRGKK